MAVSLVIGADDARAERLPPAGVGYVPVDDDERGLWMKLEAIEHDMKTSAFLIRDVALNAYVRGLLCRIAGQAPCASLRLYIVRTPEFNASMAPNGMVTVNTGMLLRARNEAQLAAVLGHEYAHFHHRHTLRTFRDGKSKAGTLAWLSVIPAVDYATALAIRLLQLRTVGAEFSFSRAMETEADAASIPLMAAAGYDPAIAPSIWRGLESEAEATAAARRKRVPRRPNLFYATHPPHEDRIAALHALAARHAGGTAGGDGAAGYRVAMEPWWPAWLDDEIKQNDFGGTDFLLRGLAIDGWTPALLYARGELYRGRGRPADLTRAADFYRRAIAGGGAADAWRGLGLASLRAGDAAEGRRALAEYLARRPEAGDREMIAMLAEEGR